MTTTDLRQIYSDTRARIVDLVAELDGDGAERIVDACPEWTIRDLIAHLAGILADVRSGSLDGVATDIWTARQVAERRGHALAELLTEWQEHASAVEPMIPDFPPSPAAQLCADLYTHEQDIRGALGRPGMREGAAFANAVEFFSCWLRGNVEQRGLGLRVNGGDHQWEVGAPTVTLTADAFELLRAYSGRRSADQIRDYSWDGDPEPYLPLMSPFGLRADPLVE